jgi:hypothetical protein
MSFLPGSLVPDLDHDTFTPSSFFFLPPYSFVLVIFRIELAPLLAASMESRIGS